MTKHKKQTLPRFGGQLIVHKSSAEMRKKNESIRNYKFNTSL